MTEPGDEPEELEVGMGSIYTRIDCPHCYECFELEGDREGETVECEFCNEKMIVRRT